MATANARRGEKVEFSAVNLFAPHNPANRDYLAPIAPDIFSQAQQQPGAMAALCGIPVTAMTLMQHFCRYEDFEIGGVRVIGSVATGTMVAFADGHKESNGYEWGVLESGDHFLSELHERVEADFTTNGKWKLIYGSGELAGIQGEATYSSRPQPGVKEGRSNLEGYYILPVKQETAGTVQS